MFEEYINLGDALFITVTSISIVFAILLLIALAITSFKYIFASDTTSEKVEVVTNKVQGNVQNKIVNLDEVEKNEEMLVATLVASIESNNNDEDKKYRILSIKEI